MQAYCAVKFPSMIKKGFIEHSTSEYRNPMHLVPYEERIKKFMSEHMDEAYDKMRDPAHADEVMAFYRFCMDFRQLNEATVSDVFPMPNTQDVIDRFTGCSYFSTFDLADAFFLVKMRESDRYKTAFSTHDMLLQWSSMPQGARNAATAFARITAKEFADRPSTVDVFQDDVSVHARSFYELLRSQEYVYEKIISLGITLKMSKAHVNMARTRVLGHLVTAGGFKIPDPKCVQGILDWDDKMATKDDIGRLIGMVGFQREYIRGLSELLAPLIDIKNAAGDTEDWKDEIHGESVRIIKKVLVSAPFLLLPDPTKKFRIHVDTATGRSIGGVLLQYYGPPGLENTLNDSADGWRVCQYYSRLLKQATPEHHMAPTEAEALGMYECIKHWESYISNGRPFDVIVDHKALVRMVKSTSDCANKSIMRRILALQGFTFNVIYKEGGKHLDADAVSRLLRFADRGDAGTQKPFGPVDDGEVEILRRMVELLEGTDVGLVSNDSAPENTLEEFDAMSGITRVDVLRGRWAMSNKDYIMSGESVEALREYDTPEERLPFIMQTGVVLPTGNHPIELPGFDPDDPYASDPHIYRTLDTGGDGVQWILKENLVRNEFRMFPLLRETDDEELIAHHNYSTRGKGRPVTNELTKLLMRRIKKTTTDRKRRIDKILKQTTVRAAQTDLAQSSIHDDPNLDPNVTFGWHSEETLPEAIDNVNRDATGTLPQKPGKPRKRGPKTVKPGKPTKPLDVDEEARQARIAEGEARAFNYQHLLGRIFRHPDNNQAYEVEHVRYEHDRGIVSAKRSAINEHAGTAEDLLYYAVEGPTGIAKLVEEYNQFAELDSIQRWPEDENEMLALQQVDPEWHPILKQLKGTTDRCVRYLGHFECFQPTLPDGSQGALRIRRTDASAERRRNEVTSKYVVALPKVLRKLALTFSHESGHPGRDRLHANMGLSFFWRGMHRDVEEHVKACSFCALRKASNRRDYIPTQQYDIPGHPFEFIHIDNIVNLPLTINGNKHILVIKCRLTKWVEMIALPNLKAATVAKALVEEVYCRHGIATRIVSDRGTEFLNSTMKYVDALLQQHHIYTTPYNPKSNGQVENQNRTIKDMLANYVGEFHKDWDQYLCVIKHAYNTTVNTATGYSPFYALYGREASQTTDTWIQAFHPKIAKDIDRYVTNLQSAMLHCWSDMGRVINNRQDAFRNREARLNATRSYIPYEPGEKFYMLTRPKIQFHDKGTKENHRLASKLQLRYTGLHTVIKQLTPVTYLCNLHGKNQVVHAQKMKRGPHPQAHRTAKLLLPIERHPDGRVKEVNGYIPSFTGHLDVSHEFENDENEPEAPVLSDEELQADTFSQVAGLFEFDEEV